MMLPFGRPILETPMTDLFSTAENADRSAALLLQDRLRAGDSITRAALNEAMTKAYGGTDAQGCWTQRESFEVLEHALMKMPEPIEWTEADELAASPPIAPGTDPESPIRH